MELKHQLHWRQEPQTFLDAVVVGVFPGNTEPSSDSMPVMQPGLGHEKKKKKTPPQIETLQTPLASRYQ